MIKLAVAGATGRMGRAVIDVVSQDDRFEIAAALTAPGCPTAGSTVRANDRDVIVTEKLNAGCDVLIDFTVADGTMVWLEACEDRNLSMVIGATGHDGEQVQRIEKTARTIPIVKASNFAVGIQAILGIVRQLVTELGDGYDVEVVESHHRYKIDAPSGTALTLVDEVQSARARSSSPDAVPGSPQRDAVVFGRHGRTGTRPPGQIGVHAIRRGGTIGHHEIHFSGHNETITLRHTAHSRETFATGALRAAAWVAGQTPGLYSMRDVLA